MEAAAGERGAAPHDIRMVVGAAAAGTIFEWYDFYIYGAILAVIASQFFGGINETAAYVFALLGFGAGFVARPFGALVFGRIGDRKCSHLEIGRVHRRRYGLDRRFECQRWRVRNQRSHSH